MLVEVTHLKVTPGGISFLQSLGFCPLLRPADGVCVLQERSGIPEPKVRGG